MGLVLLLVPVGSLNTKKIFYTVEVAKSHLHRQQNTAEKPGPLGRKKKGRIRMHDRNLLFFFLPNDTIVIAVVGF